jgi:hypothetical protein
VTLTIARSREDDNPIRPLDQAALHALSEIARSPLRKKR